MKKPLKRVSCPSLGRMIAFGRRHPVALGPRLKMSRYLLGSLPAPPASCDWTAAALEALRQMYGNDVLGDCVIAAGYHIEGVETGNAGDMFIATEAQIEKDYGAIGGYVPGDPSTDQGCDEVTAMNWWAANGFADKVKPLGWISVDPTNKTEVMQALYLFENCMFGIDLPDAWVNPMPSASGFTWDAAGSPDPENGHGFNGAGYDSAGVKICTWGMLGKITWAAIAKYAAQSADGPHATISRPYPAHPNPPGPRADGRDPGAGHIMGDRGAGAPPFRDHAIRGRGRGDRCPQEALASVGSQVASLPHHHRGVGRQGDHVQWQANLPGLGRHRRGHGGHVDHGPRQGDLGVPSISGL